MYRWAWDHYEAVGRWGRVTEGAEGVNCWHVWGCSTHRGTPFFGTLIGTTSWPAVWTPLSGPVW